ncbi:DMT family transporter [uncultured Clostridium sp.]|uniref:DMT family transporter n=1 Tax=uncultured Clostridium sp. TaxID=59620 RepID=UPI0026189C17|nr:DMT family transporter [uncultured Clostridium sp.]
MKSTTGLIFAILASVCFGFLGIFAQIGYNAGSNPTTVLIVRFFLATIILGVVILVTGKSLKITRKQLVMLFFIGAIGYTVTTQALFDAYQYIGVGLATGIHFIYPLFVCVFGFLFAKERFTKRKVFALIISIAGVFLLSISEQSGIDIRGVALAFFSGIIYGGTVFVMGKEEIKSLNGMVITFYCSLFACIITFFIGLARGQIITKMNVHIGFAYISIAIVSTVLALVFLQMAIQRIGPSNTSILGTFEPIVGILASWVFFNEVIDGFTIIGMALVVISVIILARDKEQGVGEITEVQEFS